MSKINPLLIDALGSEYKEIRLLAVLIMLDIRQVELAETVEELEVIRLRNKAMVRAFDKALWSKK